MSDADDQLGDAGGETGRPPGGQPPTPAAEEAARAARRQKPDKTDEDRVTEDSEDSFPASDPPGRY